MVKNNAKLILFSEKEKKTEKIFIDKSLCSIICEGIIKKNEVEKNQ